MKNCFWLKSMNVEMAKVGRPTVARSLGLAVCWLAAPPLAHIRVYALRRRHRGFYQLEQAKLDAARAEALLEAQEAGHLAAKTGSARGTVWPARDKMPAGWDQPGTVVPSFDEDEIVSVVRDRRYGGCS